MVLAGEQVVERVGYLGFGALRQFLRPPGLAHLACGAVMVAFGKNYPREREAAASTCRLIACKAMNLIGAPPPLPRPPPRPPAHQTHARPAWVIGNERRISAEIRVGVRV